MMFFKQLLRLVPRQPVQDAEDIVELCPTCGETCGWTDVLAWEHPNYCGNCGQRLDWSDHWPPEGWGEDE